MAFRATNIVPMQGYEQAKTLAVRARQMATNQRTRALAGMNADDLFALAERLNDLHGKLQAVASTPGIVAYAQDQESDPAYDVAAEFTALMAAVAAARDEIIGSFPTSGGYLLSHQFNGGVREPRQFTAANLAVLVTRLQAVIDAVQ